MSNPRKKSSKSALKDKNKSQKGSLLSYPRVSICNIKGKEEFKELIRNTFTAYNSARLYEACRLFAEKMLRQDVTVGLSIAGALTPAGLGASCIVPLIKSGFIDWIVSTGANLYHDTHFAFDLPIYRGNCKVDDVQLRRNNIVRIYDLFLDKKKNLILTDRLLKDILMKKEFHKRMGSAEFHYLLGKYLYNWGVKRGGSRVSLLASAFRYKVPVYVSAPGDSSLGMLVALFQMEGIDIQIDPFIDVNETASIVFGAKYSGGKTAVFILGGGSPKNFMLQTEPYLQDFMGIKDAGHNYFLQITDARPDTGGLSGATPQEAVSWGKIDKENLPDSVVCYADFSIALPLIVHYTLGTCKKRPFKRLYSKRRFFMDLLKRKKKKNCFR